MIVLENLLYYFKNMKTCIIIILIFLYPNSSLARSEMFALIVGNESYDFSPLNNPVNDAISVERVLNQIGFETVVAKNIKKMEFSKIIEEFSKIKKGDSVVKLFYYAGHAFQFDGKNYMIPVDFNMHEVDNILDITVCLDDVVDLLSKEKKNTNIIIIDACRDNPFQSNVEYDSKVRSMRSITANLNKQGLVLSKGAPGTFIAYSTSPGYPASDGDKGNGLYTQYLIKYIVSPGLSIEEIFKKIRRDVLISSSQQQVPWERSSLLGDFYFIEPSRENLSEKNFYNLISDAKVDVGNKMYGQAYRKLIIAKQMAVTVEQYSEVNNILISIKRSLNVE